MGHREVRPKSPRCCGTGNVQDSARHYSWHSANRVHHMCASADVDRRRVPDQMINREKHVTPIPNALPYRIRQAVGHRLIMAHRSVMAICTGAISLSVT